MPNVHKGKAILYYWKREVLLQQDYSFITDVYITVALNASRNVQYAEGIRTKQEFSNSGTMHLETCRYNINAHIDLMCTFF